MEEALHSVFIQNYPALEIIIVDDASTDQSVARIQNFLKTNSARHAIKTIFLAENLGNCAAFNRGLAEATGKYIIDFATDDIMLPARIGKQARCFEKLDARYGVIFTEAEYVNESGKHLYFHYRDRLCSKFGGNVPRGNIYAHLVGDYFISSPTMMIRKTVFDRLNGYDETLAYEDFDFWIRSSRFCAYHFMDECLTKVRKSTKSLSSGWYKKGDVQLHSTYLVCLKIKELNKSQAEKSALIKRLRFEIRTSIFTGNQQEARLFLSLLKEIGGFNGFYQLLHWVSMLNFPLSPVRNLLLKVKYQT